MAELVIDYNSAIKDIQKYQQQLVELQKRESDLKSMVEKGAMSRKNYQKSLVDTRTEVKKYEESIKVLKTEMGNAMKQQEVMKTSISNLEKNIQALTQSYERLSETEKNGAKGETLLANLIRLEEELAQVRAAAGQGGDLSVNYGELAVQIEQAEQALGLMNATSEEGAAGYEQFSGHVETLRQTLEDVNDVIMNAPTEFSLIDALNESLPLVEKSFTAVKNGMNALGIESEGLDRAMSGVLSILQGINTVTRIKEALDKKSAIQQAIITGKVYAHAAAVKLQSATQSSNVIVSKAASAAQWMFNAAVNANPIGAFIALLVASVAAVYGLIKVFDIFTSSSKAKKEALAEEGRQLEENIRTDERRMEIMKAKGASEQELMNKSIDLYAEQKRAQEEHLKKTLEIEGKGSDAYNEALDKKKEANERFEKALDKTYDSLVKMAAEAEAAADKEAMLAGPMGEVEYATRQATKAFDEQKESLQRMVEQNRMTQEEANKMIAVFDEAKDKLISDEHAKEAEKNAKIYQAAKEAEVKAVKAAEDAMLSLIADGVEKQRLQLNKSYDREIEDLKNKLKTEQNLTPKAREELNKHIRLLEQKRMRELNALSREEIAQEIEREQKRLQKKLAEVKTASEEELALKQELLNKQKEAELNAIGDTEQRKQELLERYAVMEKGVTDEEKLEALRRAKENELEVIEEAEEKKMELEKAYEEKQAILQEEHRQKVLAEQKAKMLEEFEERLQLDAEKEEEALALEIQRLEERLDTLHAFDYESEEQFNKRKEELQQKVVDAKQHFAKKEEDIERKKQEALATLKAGFTDMMNTIAEENRAFALASKTLALGEIAVSTGKSIAKGVENAQAVPFPANIAAIATTIGTVMANIATAIKSVKSARFASGGLVSGPGSETSDSIPAMLSNGESVMTARATQMFAPVLSAFNMLGGGVPITTAGSTNAVLGEEMLARAVAKGIMNMPTPVVSVQEINSVNRGLNVIQDLSSISL